MESNLFTTVEYPIFDKGKLSKNFLTLLSKHMDEEWLPYYDNNTGYRFDWNIPGIEFKYIFGFENPTKPEDIPYDVWIENIPKVRSWVRWVSTELFDPERLIKSTWLTDRVLMRIATSKIDKITIPKKYLDTMFDNMHFCYYTRKNVYDMYYSQIILKLPF